MVEVLRPQRGGMLRPLHEEIEVEYEDCSPQLMKARAYALNEIRDRIIVELRQGKDGYDPMSEQEIAQVMGISQPRVSQVVIRLR